MDLPVGEYFYKYIVDEQWVVNKNQVGNHTCTEQYATNWGYSVASHLLSSGLFTAKGLAGALGQH